LDTYDTTRARTGEYHFLNEAIGGGGLYIRLPYDLKKFNNVQKMLQDPAKKASLKAFIHNVDACHRRFAEEQMKHFMEANSTTPQQMRQLSSEGSGGIQNIDAFLATHNLHLRNVRDDGNCGVWAVLQARHTGNSYLTPTATNENTGTHWQAMLGLRQNAAGVAQTQGAPEATHRRILNHGLWLDTTDFKYFAMNLASPIVIVQAGEQITHYAANGEETIITQDTFSTFVDQSTIVIYQEPNHYQAIVPNVHRQA